MLTTTPFERKVAAQCRTMSVDELIDYGNKLTVQLAGLKFGTVEYSVILTQLNIVNDMHDLKTGPRPVRPKR